MLQIGEEEKKSVAVRRSRKRRWSFQNLSFRYEIDDLKKRCHQFHKFEENERIAFLFLCCFFKMIADMNKTI